MKVEDDKKERRKRRAKFFETWRKWSAQESAEFEKSVSSLRTIDKEMWQ